MAFITVGRNGNYPTVKNFAALPTPTQGSTLFYMCEEDQGSRLTFNFKKAGLYHSDGTVWKFVNEDITTLAVKGNIRIDSTKNK